MNINSDLSHAKHTSETNAGNLSRREEWILTAKLGLLAVAIFGTLILIGMWQH